MRKLLLILGVVLFFVPDAFAQTPLKLFNADGEFWLIDTGADTVKFKITTDGTLLIDGTAVQPSALGLDTLTTAQRDALPNGTYLFYNSTSGNPEFYNGTTGSSIIAGAGGGEANTYSTLGTGTYTVVGTKTGDDLPHRELIAGTNITMSQSATGVTINSTGGGAADSSFTSAMIDTIINNVTNRVYIDTTLVIKGPNPWVDVTAYASLQDSYDAVPVGGTWFFPAGTHNYTITPDSFTIGKSINIKGVPGGGSIWQGDGVSGNDILYIKSDSVTFEDIAFTAWSRPIQINGPVSDIMFNRVEWFGNHDRVVSNDPNDVTSAITNLSFLNCVIKDGDGGVLLLGPVIDAQVIGNKVHDLTNAASSNLSGFSFGGIQSTSSEHVFIGNIFRDLVGGAGQETHAILVNDSRVVISGNVLDNVRNTSGEDGEGIYLKSVAGVVSGNVLRDASGPLGEGAIAIKGSSLSGLLNIYGNYVEATSSLVNHTLIYSNAPHTKIQDNILRSANSTLINTITDVDTSHIFPVSDDRTGDVAIKNNLGFVTNRNTYPVQIGGAHRTTIEGNKLFIKNCTHAIYEQSSSFGEMEEFYGRFNVIEVDSGGIINSAATAFDSLRIFDWSFNNMSYDSIATAAITISALNGGRGTAVGNTLEIGSNATGVPLEGFAADDFSFLKNNVLIRGNHQEIWNTPAGMAGGKLIVRGNTIEVADNATDDPTFGFVLNDSLAYTDFSQNNFIYNNGTTGFIQIPLYLDTANQGVVFVESNRAPYFADHLIQNNGTPNIDRLIINSNFFPGADLISLAFGTVTNQTIIHHEAGTSNFGSEAVGDSVINVASGGISSRGLRVTAADGVDFPANAIDHIDELDETIISSATLVTAVGTDTALIKDATDGLYKKSLVSDFAGPGSGETNTISSQGSGGIGMTATTPKSGVDLRVRSMSDSQFLTNADSIGLNLAYAADWTGAHSFLDDNISLWNPAATFRYIISTSAIAANRTLTIPVLSGNDSFTFINLSQILTNKNINWANNTMTLSSSEFAAAASDEVGTGSIVLQTDGTFLGTSLNVGGGAAVTELRLLEASGSGTNYASFDVPALAANTNYVLPPDDGDAGEQLQTDGAGTLTWEAAGSGSGAFSDAGDPVVLNTTTKDVNIGTTHNNTAKLSVDGDADQVQFTVQENGTQTDASVIVETSAGTEIATIEPGGLITTAVGLDAIGAVDLDLGSADVTDVLVTTDGGTVTLDGVVTASGAVTGSNLSGTNTGDEASASTTVSGVAEIATSAEVNTGTDATRTISPDALAGSNAGIRYMQAVLFDFTTATATGDGKFYAHVPPGLDGMNLIYVHAEAITAGTTNTTDIQIHNVDNALDMLSTVLTIDSGETGSDTAATPAVINTSNDHINTNDVIRFDVDAVSTTPANGLIVTLGFQLP